MRTAIFALVLALILVGAAPAVGAGAGAPAGMTLEAQQPEPPVAPPVGQIDVDIDTGGAWYTEPIWIIAGLAGLAVIIALIAMATRGGGTTVVRG